MNGNNRDFNSDGNERNKTSDEKNKKLSSNKNTSTRDNHTANFSNLVTGLTEDDEAHRMVRLRTSMSVGSDIFFSAKNETRSRPWHPLVPLEKMG